MEPVTLIVLVVVAAVGCQFWENKLKKKYKK
jgi:hypothetical protein